MHILKMQQIHIQVVIIKLNPYLKNPNLLLNVVITMTITLQNLSNNLIINPYIPTCTILPELLFLVASSNFMMHVTIHGFPIWNQKKIVKVNQFGN